MRNRRTANTDSGAPRPLRPVQGQDAAAGIQSGQGRNRARLEDQARRGLPGTPQLACGSKGCYRPWADHLTAKGNPRVWAKGHAPADLATMVRRTERQNRTFIRHALGRSAAKRKAPASFLTHIAVKVSPTRVIRMTIEEYQAMRARANREQPSD